ncbi:putative acetyl-CoA carboxylase, carboxytransferase, alpha subunit [Xanthomonas citri pv. fuscans]|nr:putative acetyl-CoA carboxylase, carboxytransferase, alpha subunit [Xanthomonas citri pv. fuscans]
MNPNYLDFEQPIADLEAKIQELRKASTGPAVNVETEVRALRDKLRVRTAQIFRDLSAWQVSQLVAQRTHFGLHVDRRPGTGLAQFLDLCFQIGDGLLEVEVVRIHAMASST